MGLFDFMRRGRQQPLPSRGARGPFMAAAVDRLTASWVTTQNAINDELRSDLDRLRMRSRDLSKNNDIARKFLRMVARNVVGPSGVILQARVMDGPKRPDALANSAIEGAWARWSKRGSAEITGKLSFADVQRTVISTVARDGEALVRLIRGADARNPERFAVQLLDVARLDTQRNEQPASGRSAVIMGVEVDDYLRPLAYWLKPRTDANSSAAVRVPASEIVHVFLPENAEQVRGLPWMHAAMLSMHDLGEFNRAALLTARRGAETLGFIVSPDGSASGIADDTADGEAIKISAPGTYDVLPEGYDIRTPDYAYPNQVFDPFTKAFLRRIASGLDVAYNSLANDLEGVNYSSIRAGVLEERDQWMTLQQWYVDAFLEPIYSAWFDSALTAGTITMPNGSPLPAAKADKFRAHEWQPRRWSWVDPLKDIESARLAVRSGIASPQQIAAQNGQDIEDVLDAIAAFEAMAKDKGVSLVDYESKAAPPPAEPAPVEPAA